MIYNHFWDASFACRKLDFDVSSLDKSHSFCYIYKFIALFVLCRLMITIFRMSCVLHSTQAGSIQSSQPRLLGKSYDHAQKKYHKRVISSPLRYFQSITSFYSSKPAINSESNTNSSSVPLNSPAGMAPDSVPFLAMSAISSAVKPVPNSFGAAGPPSRFPP